MNKHEEYRQILLTYESDKFINSKITANYPLKDWLKTLSKEELIDLIDRDLDTDMITDYDKRYITYIVTKYKKHRLVDKLLDEEECLKEELKNE